MKKKTLFIFLLSTLLLNLSSSAIVNLTDFLNQQKGIPVLPVTDLKGSGNEQCLAGQLWTKEKGCIMACEKQLLADCQDVFGDVGSQDVCGFGGAGWGDFGSKCSACQEPGVVGYTSGKCLGLIPEINVGIALNDPAWSDKLPGIPICKDFQIYTKERGCIQACSHPDFKKCADNFIAIYNPRFCALGKNGEWKNFSFACQACPKSYPLTEYIGVSDGACGQNSTSIPDVPAGKCKVDKDCLSTEKCQLGTCLNKCSGILCKAGTKCENGQCISNLPAGQCLTDKDCSTSELCNAGLCVAKEQKCGNVICKTTEKCVYGKCIGAVEEKCGGVSCPAGTSCKANKCVPNINVCPANAKYETKVCTEPRPDKTCGPFFYIRAPDPAYCGIRSDGTRINFFEQCSTCKDKSIVYYFTSPCHKIPFTCNPSETCNDYYCISKCQSDEACPYDWQMCVDGQCIDRCAVMRCAKGPCRFGQCAFEEPSGKCTLGVQSGCKEGLQCVGFQCADLCLRQACGANQRCDKGNCIAVKPARRI